MRTAILLLRAFPVDRDCADHRRGLPPVSSEAMSAASPCRTVSSSSASACGSEQLVHLVDRGAAAGRDPAAPGPVDQVRDAALCGVIESTIASTRAICFSSMSRPSSCFPSRNKLQDTLDGPQGPCTSLAVSGCLLVLRSECRRPATPSRRVPLLARPRPAVRVPAAVTARPANQSPRWLRHPAQRRQQQIANRRTSSRQPIVQLEEQLVVRRQFQEPLVAVDPHRFVPLLALNSGPAPVDVLVSRLPAERAGIATAGRSRGRRSTSGSACCRRSPATGSSPFLSLRNQLTLKIRGGLSSAAEVQPVPEVVAHVVAAERQHRERIAPHLACCPSAAAVVSTPIVAALYTPNCRL